MFIRYCLVVSLVLAIVATAASQNTDTKQLRRNRRQTSTKFCPPLRSLKINVTCVLRDAEVSCIRNVRPGTTAKAKCQRYYKPSFKPSYTRLTCLDNGRWDNAIFYCIPECGSSILGGPLNRIVDGKPAELGSFPWHAGLYYRKDNNGVDSWEQRCGGSLITDQFVISVAHCVVDILEDDIRVALGKYYRSWDTPEKGEAKRTVSKIIYQREFSKSILTFDIALLRLNEKITFSETIMPVCRGFPGGTTYLKNRDLYVSGWGLTRDGDLTSASSTLLYNSVVVVNDDVCRRSAPTVYPTFDKFCTVKGRKPFSDVSIVQRGDSGGGITVVYDGLHVILGAVSAKESKYSIFTNFTWPYNVIWIESEIRKFDSTFRWDDNAITDIQISDRGCVIPEASSSRKFCSLTDGCEDCDIHDRLCFIPPGSKVDRVRVVCAPGFTLRSPYHGADVAICLNGKWYPEIPQCHRFQYIPGNPMTRVTWQEARDNCLNKGHQLATIKNNGELRGFKDAVKKYFKAKGMKRENVWVGLSDLKLNSAYEWVDGALLNKNDFANWNPGEPSDNFKNPFPTMYLEHCTVAISGCGEDCFNWNDEYCSQLYFYFCKEIVPEDETFDRVSDDSGDINRPRYTYLPGNPWTKVTWDEARDNCKAKGSQLAIMRNTDQRLLFEKTVAKHFNDTGTAPSSVWIGLRLAKIKNQRLFSWTDGSVYNAWRPTDWNNWIVKRSNWNWECTEAAAGKSLELWPYATIYQWNDVNCTDLNYYFCSIKII